MLLTADRNDDYPMAAVPVEASVARGAPPSPAPSARRYGEQRPVNLPALIVACLIPALVAAVLLQTGTTARHKSRPRLVVMNLSAPPPPPPPAQKAAPPPKTALTAPAPVLQVPRPTPPMIVPVAPVPQPSPVPVAVAPAPPAPPAVPSTVKASNLGAHMISAVPPSYPMESRRRHEQGTVVLGLTLDATGAVADISVVESSGYHRLDDAALRAVRKWRWAPTLRDGQAVMVKGEVEIPFVLKS